jgi:hypothetical protein
MKTVSFSNTARLLPVILFILVFATGCKKEENAFPLGDIKFSLSTTDSNGVEKNTFNYGEDINFVLSEINPLKKEVVYFRGSNIPQYYFKVYDEYDHFVGRGVDDGIITTLEIKILRLSPYQKTQIGVNWLNKKSNKILPKGKYTLKYTTDITIVPDDGFYSPKNSIIKQETLTKDFWVQ